jgi:hypothetical protein
MNVRIFKTENSIDLIVKSRKSAVFFEVENHKHYQCLIEFTKEGFEEFVKYIEEIANKSWGGLIPKEANSLGADYYEYYDKELDNNGYLTVRDYWLLLERPFLDSSRFYKFNKRKMESFLYDLKK